MKRITSIVIGLSTVALAAVGSWSSSAGTISANFLNLGVGPRAIAMGDAQVGVADDVYATYWNPAGLATLRTQEAAFVNTQYVENITEQYLAYAYPKTRLGTFGGSFTYLSYGSIPGADAAGQPTSSFGAHDLDAGLSYAHPLYEEERYGTLLSVGASGKWINEQLDSVSASAFAGDFGVLFIPGIRWGEWLSGWRAGMTIRNLGSSMKFDQESFGLPRTEAAGLSYTGNWRDEVITVALDGRNVAGSQQSYGVGLEVLTWQMIVFRCGYTTQGDLGNGLRIGAGLKFKTLQFDYAFASEGDLGTAHRFGLTLRFSPSKPNPYLLAQHSFDKGAREFNRAQYTDALADFNKALELDPKHPNALDMMKRSYEKIQETNPQ